MWSGGCGWIYQRLDGPQRLKEARQQVSPPLIGQQTQTGFCESFLRHAQLSTRKATQVHGNYEARQLTTVLLCDSNATTTI